MNKTILRLISLPERFRNFVLYLLFGFDKWHISPSKNRIYPRDICKYINNLSCATNVCEIGCGLGDIISPINAKRKIGCDIDKNVLRAASWIHKRKTNLEFKYFSFPEDPLLDEFDTIIAVNWIHNFDNETIKRKFNEYFNSNLAVNGILIVDSIDNPNYKYYHEFEKYFSNTKSEVKVLGTYLSNRKVLAIKKISNEN